MGKKSGPDKKPRVRQRAPSELLSDLTKAVRYLDEAIARYDEGDLGGADRVAGLLRLLVGKGLGNELLVRLSTRLQLPKPMMAVDTEVPADPTLTFAFGALPVAPDIQTASRLSIEGVMRMRCLVAEDPLADPAAGEIQQVHYTWHDFISISANKFLLVHSDDELPGVFDEIATYRVGNEHHIVPFLLRNFGIGVSAMVSQFFKEAAHLGYSVGYEPIQHSYSLNGMTIFAVQVRGSI